MWIDKDGKAYPVLKKIILGDYVICNPTKEQIIEAGYEWREPTPPEPPAPVPQRYSKYKIIKALGDQWPTYKAEIEAAGLYDLFLSAEYLEEGDPLFDGFIATIPEELKEKLNECLWDY